MKHRFIILLCLLIAAIPSSYAQQKISSEKEKMIQERTEYMKARLNLSKSESKAFWPVYKKYLNSEISLHEAFRERLSEKGIKLNHPCNNKEVFDKLSDAQLTYLQDQRFQLKKDLLSLDLNYYNKYKAILTPRNLVEYYRIDEEFKRNISNKMREQNTEVQTKGRR